MPFGQAKTYGFNNPKVTRIVVSGTGPGTGVFIYNGSPGLGNPPITWMTNGSLVDPYGNVLPAVIGVEGVGTFSAGDTIITPNGTFDYSGTPALGNLIGSDAPAAGNDEFGNNYYAGKCTYQASGGAIPTLVVQMFAGNLSIGSAAAIAGTAGHSPAQLKGFSTDQFLSIFGPVSGPTDSGATLLFQSEAGSGSNQPLISASVPIGLGAAPSMPTGANACIYTNTSGNPVANTNEGVQGVIPLTQTDGGIASGNVTNPTLITSAYTLDSALTPGSTYTIKLWFNGTWGNQVMTISADISGTQTNVGGVAAAFATGAASGDSVNGWIELEVYVASTTTCRCSVSGNIHDSTVAANNSVTATCGITGTVATGVAIAGGDTLGIAIKFAASVVGQTIVSEGARFTRSGN